jgi:hypothetical protein
VRQNGRVIEFTQWAQEILEKSDQAARRFNPDAKIRLARIGGTVQAVLTDEPETNDEPVELGPATIYVQAGLEGLVDVEEPHDRLVLKPKGSPPNARGSH